MLPENCKKFMECVAKLEKAEDFQGAPPHFGEQMTKLIGENYNFVRYHRRCGESMIFEIFDDKKQIDIALKIARSDYNAKGGRAVEIRSQKLNDYSVDYLGNPLTKRFLRGAKIQEAIANCVAREVGIVPAIYEISIYPLYFLMEWIQGQTLLAWCLDKPFLRTAKFFVRLLRLVEATHENNIVHGDIKPGNIMVVEESSGNAIPALLDFSVAKNIAKQDEGVTKVGTPIYTEHYASPLMMRDAAKRTFFDDIYMLGKTLLAVYFKRELGDKRNVVAELDPKLRAIVEKATDIDPRQRYRTVTALREDLESYVIGSEHTAIETQQDVVFDDAELSDTEISIVKLLHAGMVKIAADRM